MNVFRVLICVVVPLFLAAGCAASGAQVAGERESVATQEVNGITADDWVQMTRSVALWSGVVTHLLDTDEVSKRVYDERFVQNYFDTVIASDFDGWKVLSPFGEKIWATKAAFMHSNTGYISYNKKFANNAEHTVTTPVIISTGPNTALMYVNVLNRTVGRLESDNSVPMWKTNIYWAKSGGTWRITKGVSFFENP